MSVRRGGDRAVDARYADAPQRQPDLSRLNLNTTRRRYDVPKKAMEVLQGAIGGSREVVVWVDMEARSDGRFSHDAKGGFALRIKGYRLTVEQRPEEMPKDMSRFQKGWEECIVYRVVPSYQVGNEKLRVLELVSIFDHRTGLRAGCEMSDPVTNKGWARLAVEFADDLALLLNCSAVILDDDAKRTAPSPSPTKAMDPVGPQHAVSHVDYLIKGRSYYAQYGYLPLQLVAAGPLTTAHTRVNAFFEDVHSLATTPFTALVPVLTRLFPDDMTGFNLRDIDKTLLTNPYGGRDRAEAEKFGDYIFPQDVAWLASVLVELQDGRRSPRQGQVDGTLLSRFKINRENLPSGIASLRDLVNALLDRAQQTEVSQSGPNETLATTSTCIGQLVYGLIYHRGVSVQPFALGHSGRLMPMHMIDNMASMPRFQIKRITLDLNDTHEDAVVSSADGPARAVWRGITPVLSEFYVIQ